MKTRYTYSTTVRVPVAANWTCSKCGKSNSSFGMYHLVSAYSSSALFRKKAKTAAEEGARQWRSTMLNIITAPEEHEAELRLNLKLTHMDCAGCGHRELWAKGKDCIALGVMLLPCMIGALILGLVKGTLLSWIPFLVLLGLMGLVIYDDDANGRRMKKLPKESLPSIQSLSPELNEYARECGISVAFEATATESGAASSEP